MITEYPQFFTATNLEWKNLLKADKQKRIVISSLEFLVKNQRIILFAFVIMPNHIHLIWQMRPLIDLMAVQRDFLKYTAQKIKASISKDHSAALSSFKVNARDRAYQFWERNSLSIELRTHKGFLQKIEYIHRNPVKAGLCSVPGDYLFSSAKFYETGVDNWGFLTHYAD